MQASRTEVRSEKTKLTILYRDITDLASLRVIPFTRDLGRRIRHMRESNDSLNSSASRIGIIERLTRSGSESDQNAEEEAC